MTASPRAPATGTGITGGAERDQGSRAAAIAPVDGAPAPDPNRAILVRTDVSYPQSVVVEPVGEFEYPEGVSSSTVVEHSVLPARGLRGEHVQATVTISQQRREGAHGRTAYALGSSTVAARVVRPDEPVRVTVLLGDDWAPDLMPGRPVVVTSEVTFPCTSLLQPGADGPHVHLENLPAPTWSMWNWVN